MAQDRSTTVDDPLGKAMRALTVFASAIGLWSGCGGDSAPGVADVAGDARGASEASDASRAIDGPPADGRAIDAAAGADVAAERAWPDAAADGGPDARDPDGPQDAAIDVPSGSLADVASEASAPDAAADVATDTTAATDSATVADLGAVDVDVPSPDVSADLAPATPNIGAWCDPAQSDGARANPACLGGTTCLVVRAPTDGMCVIFGCSVDLPTEPAVEDSCGPTFGVDYVCIDLDGEFGDLAEIYDPPAYPDGQNANLADNVCLPTCTPRSASNDCAAEFACAPDSTRLHFDGAVCYFPACLGGADCAVTVAPPGSCLVDPDCDTASGEFCTGVQDLDGDGTLEVRACARGGDCNPQNGLCDPHALGSPSSAIGEPCASDADCPDGGTCVLEAPVLDTFGAVVTRAPRNGYCTKLGCRFAATLPSAACPAGSECNHNYYAGGCQPACDVGDPWGCRNHDCDPGSGLTARCDWFGDLDCYDWSAWAFGNGLPMVAGPTGIVCDYDGPVFHTCEDMFYLSGGVGCPGVAPAGNPAAMDCWDVETATPLADGADPAGRCVDTTTAGPACSDYGRFCDGFCVDTGGGPCP
jgi:hypothetical protein